MSRGLMQKITEFFWTEEEYHETVESTSVQKNTKNNKVFHLRLHKTAEQPRRQQEYKMMIFSPVHLDDVQELADALKAQKSIIVNFEATDRATQRDIERFLDGVAYALHCDHQQICDSIHVYVPCGVAVERVDANCAYSYLRMR